MVDDNQYSQGANQGNQGIGQQITDMQQNANQQNGGQPEESAQIAGLISDLDRRLRVLEERYSNLRKKLQLTDQNMIESERSFGKEMRSFNADLLEVKRSIAEFDEKVTIFGTEMGNVAQKSDLRILEKYLAMWNPQIYITRSELREYLKRLNEKDVSEDE